MASSMARTRPASAGIADLEFPAAPSRCSWPRLHAPRKRLTAASEVGSSLPVSPVRPADGGAAHLQRRNRGAGAPPAG